jgi:3-phenylpropionate/trans-cinnamate dioxygenase ferredoxin subunit
MPEFRKVARAAEIPPGEMRAVEVDGEPVALYNVGGEIFATCDTCSHEEASLADGWLDDDIVTCPSHGAEFSVRTGEALSLPATAPITTYPVRVEGDDIYVALGE